MKWICSVLPLLFLISLSAFAEITETQVLPQKSDQLPSVTVPAQPGADVKALPEKIASAGKQKASISGSGGDKYWRADGLMGPVVIGPKLTAGVILPPLGAGLEGRASNLFGFSFDYRMIPAISLSTVKIKVNSYDGGLKVFPWRRAFFLGLLFGQITMTGTTSKDVLGYTVTGTAEVKRMFLTPHLGWRWTWNNGFFLGMELGVQLVMGKLKTTLSSNITEPIVLESAEFKKVESDIKTEVEKYGKLPLPHISLLQIGWYF